jgi:hypothetical protein
MHSLFKTQFIWVLAALSLFALHFNGFSSNDFWIQAAIGNFIHTHLYLPQTGLYSFTAAGDYPFIVHEWLSSLLMSFIAGINSDAGWVFAITKITLALLSFGLNYKVCLNSSKDKKISILVSILVAYALSFRLSLRAENFAFILLPLYLLLLQNYLKTFSRQTATSLILTLLVWVNMHGSFLIALVFLPASILFEAHNRKEKFLLFTASVAATGLNPYGIGLFKRALENSTSAFLAHRIQEWQPTFSSGFMHTPSFALYIFYVLLCVILIGWNFKKLQKSDLFIFVVFLVLSLMALRHTSYFYLISAPLLAQALALSSSRIKAIICYALTTLLSLACILVFSFGNLLENHVGTDFEAPLEASTLHWLRHNHVTGNVFNGYMLGDQLVYGFYPDLKVVIDSRTDFYGEDYVQRYINTLSDNESFISFITSFKIKLIILQNDEFNRFFANNRPRLETLEKMGFKLAFRSQDNIILQIAE